MSGFDHRRAADAVVADLHDSVGLDCRVLTCDRTLPQGDPATLPPPPADAGALRWVFYSSGTTAEPKGALHSDATIVAGSRAVAERYELDESDRYPMVFPFTHIGGVGMLVVQLLTGCGAIAIEQYDAELTPPLLREHEVTIPAGGTPLALLYLQYQRAHPEQRAFPALPCRYDRCRAQAARSARRAAGRDRWGRGRLGLRFDRGAVPRRLVRARPRRRAATTEGRAVPGVELRVVADDERVCGPDEVGEIRARGVVVCSGYLNPTATPRRSTATASSAPATSAGSTPTVS